MRVGGDWICRLFETYHDELTQLSKCVCERYWSMCERGYGAAFSDFEGEVLYWLLRELKPDVFFEISPDCGYSTLYAYEAIAANGTGTHYAFEIEPTKQGRPTETVIRENALRRLDPDRFRLVMGDVTETVAAYPDPDVVLIDSCHDAWFAEWYWAKLLTRVGQISLIQDIVFHDRREPSTEAAWILEALERETVPYMSLGLLERAQEFTRLREDFPPRRPYETNSILVGGRQVEVEALAPALSPPGPLDQTGVIKLENAFAWPPRNGVRYRDLARIARSYQREGNARLSDHYWTRAVTWALEETNRNQGKALSSSSRRRCGTAGRAARSASSSSRRCIAAARSLARCVKRHACRQGG